MREYSFVYEALPSVSSQPVGKRVRLFYRIFVLFEEIIEVCLAGKMRFAQKFASEFIFLSSGKKVRSPHPAPPKVISCFQECLACLLTDSLFGGMWLSWEVVVREGEGGLTGRWGQSCSAL